MVPVLRALFLVATCSLLDVCAIQFFNITLDESLEELHGISNPLRVRLGDKVRLTCGEAAKFHRYPTEFEYTTCMTSTASRPVITCIPGLEGQSVNAVTIAFNPRAEEFDGTVINYVPGVTYYYAGYSFGGNESFPSGPPCTNGAKFVLHVIDDTATTSTEDASVQTTGGLGPGGSSFGTVQIIIVAASVAAGIPVLCGVLICILVFCCFVSKKKRSKNLNAKEESGLKKEEVQSTASSNGTKQEKSTEKAGLDKEEDTPVISVDGAKVAYKSSAETTTDSSRLNKNVSSGTRTQAGTTRQEQNKANKANINGAGNKVKPINPKPSGQNKPSGQPSGQNKPSGQNVSRPSKPAPNVPSGSASKLRHASTSNGSTSRAEGKPRTGNGGAPVTSSARTQSVSVKTAAGNEKPAAGNEKPVAVRRAPERPTSKPSQSLASSKQPKKASTSGQRPTHSLT